MSAGNAKLTVHAAVQLLRDSYGAQAACDAESVLHLLVEGHLDVDGGAVPLVTILQPHLVRSWSHDLVTMLEARDPPTALLMARRCSITLLSLLELEPVCTALGSETVDSLRKAWAFSKGQCLIFRAPSLAGASTAWQRAAPLQQQQQQGTAHASSNSSMVPAAVVPSWLMGVFLAVQERCRVRPLLQVRKQWGANYCSCLLVVVEIACRIVKLLESFGHWAGSNMSVRWQGGELHGRRVQCPTSMQHHSVQLACCRQDSFLCT